MPVTVRATTAADHDTVLNLVRAAFTKDGNDGEEEVEIVRETWQRNAASTGFDLVAVDDAGRVVGHVLAARGNLDGRRLLGIAPLAVAPDAQGKGVGSTLMREVIARAERAGEPMLVLLGNPAYYGRFGFEPSGALDVHYEPVGRNSPYFQVRRLAAYEPSLRGAYSYCWEEPVRLP